MTMDKDDGKTVSKTVSSPCSCIPIGLLLSKDLLIFALRYSNNCRFKLQNNGEWGVVNWRMVKNQTAIIYRFFPKYCTLLYVRE